MKPTRSPFVVTRPAPDHIQLMARLRQVGGFPIHNPAFEFEHLAETQLSERIARLATCDLAIVTSPVAARTLAAYSKQPGIQSPGYFAPGRGTAAALEPAGLSVCFPSTGGTSEDILAMREFADVRGLAVAIVGAPGGRGLLERELSARGARVEPVHVYRRKKLPPSPALGDVLQPGCDPVVLISSLQTFGIISMSLPDALKRSWLGARFVVSSRRLALACRDAGVCRIQRAAGAADTQMLTAILEAGWISVATD